MSQIDKTLCITINTPLMCVQVFSKSTFFNRQPPYMVRRGRLSVFFSTDESCDGETRSGCLRLPQFSLLSLQVRFLLTIEGLLGLETKYNIHNITIVITLYLSVN